MSSCHPKKVQHQPAGACAVGLVPGPHTRNPRAETTRTTGPGRLLQGMAAWRGKAPKLSHPSQWREKPPLPPPATPKAHKVQDGMQARGQRQVPTPAHPHPQRMGRCGRLRALRPGSLGRVAPNLRRPSPRQEGRQRDTSRHPHSNQARKGMQAAGPVPGSDACTAAPTECAQRSLCEFPAPAPLLHLATLKAQIVWKGLRAKRRVPRPHTHTLATTARGWRTPTACP